MSGNRTRRRNTPHEPTSDTPHEPTTGAFYEPSAEDAPTMFKIVYTLRAKASRALRRSWRFSRRSAKSGAEAGESLWARYSINFRLGIVGFGSWLGLGIIGALVFQVYAYLISVAAPVVAVIGTVATAVIALNIAMRIWMVAVREVTPELINEAGGDPFVDDTGEFEPVTV